MGKREALAERRSSCGYSQEEMAEQLGVATSTVVRWEAATSTPRPYQRPRIAQLLQLTPAQLDVLLNPVSALSKSYAGPDPLLITGDDDMRRRDVLALLAVTGAQIALPGADLSPRGRTAALAAEPGKELHRSLWQVYAFSDSKRAIFPAVRHQLDVLVRSLDDVRGPTERQRICTLIADIYQLAGEVLFDAREYTDAAHCYALAANAAQAAGDYDLWACAMTRHAYVELYTQRAVSAEPLLNAAFKVAQRGDSALSTRHWVAAVQAETYASLGDSDSCMRALDEAEQVQTLSGQVHNGGWLRFDGSRLAEERGACYLQLGRPDLAEESLTAALAQDLSLRRRGAVLVDLAALGIHQGDVDQALHYADAALILADQTHSGYIGAKLGGLRPRLATLASNARVSDLDHRIAALAGAA